MSRSFEIAIRCGWHYLDNSGGDQARCSIEQFGTKLWREAADCDESPYPASKLVLSLLALLLCNDNAHFCTSQQLSNTSAQEFTNQDAGVHRHNKHLVS